MSVARGSSPSGPFEGCPRNPVLSARSTGHPVQNLGHADLVDAPDGGTAMVLLGVRPVDAALAFSPLGRETFVTQVAWVDGWPIPELPEPGPGAEPETYRADLSDDRVLDDLGWIAVRRAPRSVASLESPGILTITSDAVITEPRPAFLGRRQRHHDSVFFAVVDAREGVGGVAARLRENHVVAVEANDDGSRTVVSARAVLAGLGQTWTAELPSGPVRLSVETGILPVDLRRGQLGGELISLVAAVDGHRTVLAELDGRYWSYETAMAFTGRVVGVYAESGVVRFSEIGYDGLAPGGPPDASLSS